MKARHVKILAKLIGILFLIGAAGIYSITRENISQKAAAVNMVGHAQLKFSKSSYQLSFQRLSKLDESKIETELKKIHQITEKISATSISQNGEIMITLAKSIDNNIVMVIFKNQQIQMIQKVLAVNDNRIDFQYGTIEFLPEQKQKLAYSANIELEF
jgi:hypothetical protein